MQKEAMGKAPLLRSLRFVLHQHGSRAPRGERPLDGLVIFELPRDEGLSLLDWLGLGRPEFGAIDARALLPRCRRRLWPEFEGRARGSPRALVARLLVTIEMYPDGVIEFG